MTGDCGAHPRPNLFVPHHSGHEYQQASHVVVLYANHNVGSRVLLANSFSEEFL